MPFVTKPCPNCGHEHGHGRWAIANSSAIRPLRCKRCGEFFHQRGLRIWFWSYLLVPTSVFFLIHWLAGLLAAFVELLLVSLYINRRQPLVRGPRYG